MSGLWYEPVRWIEDREWIILRPTVLATFSSRWLKTVVLQSTAREFTKERTSRAARILFSWSNQSYRLIYGLVNTAIVGL